MRATMRSLLVSCILICGCNSGQATSVPAINQEASAVADLPFNLLKWNVITTQIDRRRGCMATLYGNKIALTHAMSLEDEPMPPKSQIALVTWSQKTDPHWFGAKIPGKVKTVELVYWKPQTGQADELTYERYEGVPLLAATDIVPGEANQRIRYIASLKAAVMP